MFYGEIYGYAHYLQKERMIPNKVQFMWYDIICMYWPWLIKQDPATANAMKSGLSVMHAKAHSWSCQVLWGGRWQESAAGTTGEEVEQINSHFSRLGNSTKHMRPEGREELLTEHALAWNKWKIQQMPLVLSKRYLKFKKQAELSQSKVQTSLYDLGIDGDDQLSIILKWIDEVKLVAQEEQSLQAKKILLSEDEKVFLCDSLVCQISCQHDKILLKYAAKLFSKYYKNMANKDASLIRDSTKEKLAHDWDVTLQRGKELLKKQVIKYLERSMQSLHFTISQIVLNMNKLAGSSKQLTRLRRKISSSQTALKEFVADYNFLRPSCHLEMADVQYGKFPWQPEHERNGIPVRVKKSVAEHEMERRRYKEEIDIVRKEMENYLHYYKDVVIPNLKRQQQQLTSQSLTDVTPRRDVNIDEVEDDIKLYPGKYYLNSSEPSIVRGKMALLRRGVDYAINQLSFGVDIFRDVLDSKLSQSILDELELALNASVSDEEDINEDEDDSLDEDECSADVVSISLDNLTDTADESVYPDVINADVHDGHCIIWKLPFEINQGSIGGRNGSSACSLIALIIGHVVQTQQIQYPDTGPLSPIWLSLLVRCMELGNKVYDNFRQNLPSRYLSTAEACDILSGIVPLTPDSPLPVRLVDSYRPSTVAAQLELLLDDSANKVAVFTISDKSSVFILRPPSILFIDSHCHIPNGAVIVKGIRGCVNEFCQRVWDVQELSSETYGNLVVLRDPITY